MTTRRKSANIYDYPEHLNPFHEEDNHNRLRFWTVTKKKTRSNSFSFQSIKDFRGSIRLPGSRNRTDTSSSLSQLNCYGTKPKNETHSESSQSHNRFFSTLRKLSRSFSIRNKNKNSNSSLDQTSQIENDEVQIRVSPTRPSTESYSASQRLSVTPLPRSRFHERVRNSQSPEPERQENLQNVQSEKPAEKTDSPATTPTDDKNPFNDESDDETHVTLRSHSPSRPVTPARKKKRAPPPPPKRQSSLKAKTLLDYKASKQNEADSSISVVAVETTVVKDESEKINTNDNENHVNIQIKVEDVTDASELKEETRTENISENTVEVSSTEETIQSKEVETNEETIQSKEVETNEETSPEENLKISVNETINSQTQEKKTIKEEILTEETKKTEETTSEDNVSVQNTNEKTSSAEPIRTDITNTEQCINYNTELTLSSSHSSISSETKLEEVLQQGAIQDTSDLVELVTKLKMEVDKLTDDTNNNVIESEEERKARNIQSWIKLDSPRRKKSELNVYLDSDDDDVCTAPLSPRLVRLRKDNEWIRQQN